MKEKLQKFMNKFGKATVLFLASVVFVVLLSFLLTGILNECKKARNWIVGYMESKTKQEQADHSTKMQRVLSEVENDVFSLDDLVFRIGSEEGLGMEEKKEFLFVMRRLEENATSLSDEFSAYFDDLSVQYSPFADDEITSLVYENRNFSIALKRFVRQSEFVLLGFEEPTLKQGELLAEQYYEVVWYVEQLTNGAQTQRSE